MAYDLQIEFSGLFGLVTATDEKRAVLVGVDGDHPFRDPHGRHHPDHVAVLRIAETLVDPDETKTTKKIDAKLYRKDEAKLTSLWFLRGLDVSFAAADGTKLPKLSLYRTNGKLSTVPKAGEERDIRWLPDLSVIRPSLARISPNCLRADDPSPPVATRFYLDSGELGTGGFAHDKNTVWSFLWTNHRQALTAELHLLLRGLSVPIAFTLEEFAGTKPKKITLQAPANGTVVVRVENVPWMVLAGGDMPHEETHFTGGYNLSDAQISSAVRLPEPRMVKSGAGGRNVPCMGPKYLSTDQF